MKNIFLFLFFPMVLFSQVNFSEDISPIIYNHCTECHRVGGAGPMPFTNYEEVAALGFMVEYVTQSGYMPPWHADPDYSHFIGERVLTESDKQLISDWVANGMPQGDPSLEAEIPAFPQGSVIGTPDAVLTMEEEYLIQGNNQDDYRVFVFSTNFNEDKYLKSIEIIPGNLSAVHHVLVNIDTEGACAALDASTPEYGYECESGFCVGNIPQLSAGYTPGMVPPLWNNDIGLVLPAGADIAIQMHYAPSSINEYDQSSVNLFFKDQPVEREVEVLTIVDTQLEIPANEVYTHYQSYEIPFDMSIISVLPHMHLIGKSWLIYAENDGDTIPIISIPDWDFNWQTFYQPEYMLKLPEGYTLHAYATYDNTSTNPTNPNNPPQDMYWCDYTTCEMFFLPFAYVPYQDGDEDIYIGDENDLGCMDSEACNYNPDAIIQPDAICEYDNCTGCMDPFACNYDFNATLPSDCDYASCVGCLSEEACDFCPECTIPSICDYSCYGCMDPNACNFDALATIELPCDFSCIGCTDEEACNYNSDATIDDGLCGVEDDCGVCHIPCCYNLDTQICDYSVSQDNCENYWPSLEEITSDLNPYWNADCVYGCTNPFAFNYDSTANIDDGSCVYEILGCIDPFACNYNFNANSDDESCIYIDSSFLNCQNCSGELDGTGTILYGCQDQDGECNYYLEDIDGDGFCDELECLDVFCQEFYECILGDCVCINDDNGDGICDENEDNCLDLTLLSINQINPDQFTVIVENSAWDNIFSYPGFILFNEFGDTIAMENVNFYGITEQSIHILDIQDNIEITDNLNLELYTSFYDYLACQWNDVMISDNCELEPQSGECEAVFPAYYFNQDNNQCEEFIWGGCYGVVPFWNLEDCQSVCESVAIPEIEFAREIMRQTDVLGRSVFGTQGFIIQLYNDGSVEKELILRK